MLALALEAQVIKAIQIVLEELENIELVLKILVNTRPKFQLEIEESKNASVAHKRQKHVKEIIKSLSLKVVDERPEEGCTSPVRGQRMEIQRIKDTLSSSESDNEVTDFDWSEVDEGVAESQTHRPSSSTKHNMQELEVSNSSNDQISFIQTDNDLKNTPYLSLSESKALSKKHQ